MDMMEQVRRLKKPARTKDPELLRLIKGKPCCVCGDPGSVLNPIDPSHIRSRGAGGPDEDWNVTPMCRRDHMSWGLLGANRFCDRNPKFKAYLESLGWEWFGPKLTHPKLQGGRK